MADKLSEAIWTTFAKKRNLDDAALVKALAKFDKTDEAKPAARIEALDEVIGQIKKQVVALAKRKAELGDKASKEAKDKLYALLDEAEKEHKASHAAHSAADGDEEADSPVLLTTKMVPLLRELKKPDVQMNALIGTAGKNTAVLIMRRSIAPTRRKLLAEYLDAKGGAKYIAGTCLFEQGALTFAVESEAAGLAKRIRAALLEQTGLRIKVRVRGPDGALDDDGEEASAADGDPTDAPAPTAGSEPPPAPSAASLGWTQRRQRTQPALDAALAADHREATKLRALQSFAVGKADDGDYAAAAKALDMIDQLLKATAAPAAAAAPGPTAGARTPAPAIVYTQTRLAWAATRSKVQAELQKLEGAILDNYRDQPVLPQVAQSVRQLDRVLAMFDETLADNLDGALNATDAAEKLRWHDEARAVIARYQGFLAEDPLVQELDANPFVPITVQATLSKTLATLASKIA